MSNCLRCLIMNRESHFANRKTFRSGRSTSVSYEPFHNRWRTLWSKCLILTHRCYVRWATQIWNTRFSMAEKQLFLGLPKTCELSAGACGRYTGVCTDATDQRCNVALELLPVADLRFTASGHFSFTGLFQIMKQFYWLPKVHPIEMMISQSLDMIAQ